MLFAVWSACDPENSCFVFVFYVVLCCVCVCAPPRVRASPHHTACRHVFLFAAELVAGLLWSEQHVALDASIHVGLTRVWVVRQDVDADSLAQALEREAGEKAEKDKAKPADSAPDTPPPADGAAAPGWSESGCLVTMGDVR